MSEEFRTPDRGVSQDNRLTNLVGVLPLSSLLVLLVLAWLWYQFFTGGIYQFYASIVFLFYALTNKMWVSVILLGVFQTILLMPLRAIRLTWGEDIKKFQEKIEKIDSDSLKHKAVKQSFDLGNKTFLFYLIDFTVQLSTFLTIGRLFLTDFYTQRLNPDLLFSFVPYPQYPINDPMFHIPYPVVTKSYDFGWQAVFWVWAILFLVQVIIWIARAYQQYAQRRGGQVAAPIRFSSNISRYTIAYLVILLWLSWALMRHFPTEFGVRIFSGDVSKQNTTFNTVTATATFLTLVYFAAHDIVRMGKKALKEGMAQHLVDATQKKMFSQGVFDAVLVGLGAFFITNQIPSAFELSVFTLEVISLLSPVTLDKWVLSWKEKHLGQTLPPAAETQSLPQTT